MTSQTLSAASDAGSFVRGPGIDYLTFRMGTIRTSHSGFPPLCGFAEIIPYKWNRWYPHAKIFPYNSYGSGDTESGESEVSAMQNQGNGQNMKSRNQNPNPQTEPQASQNQHKKKNQSQGKNQQTEGF